MKAPKTRNFVAKHMQKCGAGTHVSKKGKLAPRNRQKKAWKKEIGNVASD